ncbi:MAG: MBOAT family protein [Bacteroidetes bacterium]|nr:MBOAT family protein [Bacteroidota bacterium]
MVFSSVIFLLYFLPAFLLVYFITPAKLKNLVILLGSIGFYAWGAPLFIFAILGTTTADFFLVKIMHNAQTEKRRRLFLVLSLCLNLGMLFYFKYCNFFVANFNLILHSVGIHEVRWTNVLLPIGISFYTFESLTYAIDVYRRVHKPLNNFWNYQMYIILFPKLIAGPIVRYHEISDQISDRSANYNIDNMLTGFYRFCIGLGKKVFIANVMAAKADAIFNADVTTLTAGTAWLGALAYTFQIYFDFSGYSDMAIGLGKIMGFKFPENFNNPYTSQSITEFWRRWHMTLGNWMRNYLYIPLGGSKVDSKSRLYFNLWFVFLASGFWHGAAWTFIIWGIYHGIWLVLERAFLLKFYAKIGKIPATLICFIVVVIGWIFFRANSFSFAVAMIKKLVDFNFFVDGALLDNQFLFFGALAILFSFLTSFKWGEKIQQAIYYSYYGIKGNIVMTAAAVIVFMLSVAAITSSNFNPFIYFRF